MILQIAARVWSASFRITMFSLENRCPVMPGNTEKAVSTSVWQQVKKGQMVQLTDYYQYSSTSSRPCRLCLDDNESVSHIVCECRVLVLIGFRLLIGNIFNTISDRVNTGMKE